MGIVKERSIAVLKCAGLIPSLEVEVAERWRVRKKVCQGKGKTTPVGASTFVFICSLQDHSMSTSKPILNACVGPQHTGSEKISAMEDGTR